MKARDLIHLIILLLYFYIKAEEVNSQPCNTYFSKKFLYQNDELGINKEFILKQYYEIFYRTTNPPASYNCSLTDIHRPIILLEGFDVKNNENAFSHYHDYIGNDVKGKINDVENLLLGDELRKLGFDIISYDFEEPFVAIQIQGIALANFIEFINKEKKEKNDIVIMAFGFGAVVARYALTYMESNQIAHNVGLFLSIDGSNRGEIIPLSIQAFADTYKGVGEMFTGLGGDFHKLAQRIVDMRRSVSFKQIQMAHIEATENTYYRPHQYYKSFFNELNSMTYCSGYPGNCMKVALTVGSLSGALQEQNSVFLNPLIPNSVMVISKTYEEDFIFFTTDFSISFVFSTTPGIGFKPEPLNFPSLITIPSTDASYVLTRLNDNIIVNINIPNYEINYLQAPLDHAPGAHFYWFKLLSDNLGALLSIGPIMENTCYIPTISALGLNTENLLLPLYDIGKELTLQSSNFDDFLWDDSQTKNSHRFGINIGTDDDGNSIYLQKIYNLLNPDNSKFFGNKLYSKDQNLVLKDKEISNKMEKYNASSTIEAQDITIINGSDVDFTASTSIHIKPGFRVEKGSKFHAKIAPVNQAKCAEQPKLIYSGFAPDGTSSSRINKNAINSNLQNNTGLSTNPEKISETEEEQSSASNSSYNNKKFLNSPSFSIYPNPCHELTYLSIYKSEESDVTLCLTDMIGTLIKENKHNIPGGYSVIPLVTKVLKPGTYFYIWKTENKSGTVRLVVL